MEMTGLEGEDWNEWSVWLIHTVNYFLCFHYFPDKTVLILMFHRIRISTCCVLFSSFLLSVQIFLGQKGTVCYYMMDGFIIGQSISWGLLTIFIILASTSLVYIVSSG